MIIDLFVQAKSRHKICCSTIYFLFENKKKYHKIDRSFIYKKKSIGRFDFITEYIVSIVLFIY